jgi:hypothetical protein
MSVVEDARESYCPLGRERVEVLERTGDSCTVTPVIAPPLLKQGQTVAKSKKYEHEYTPKEWEP